MNKITSCLSTFRSATSRFRAFQGPRNSIGRRYFQYYIPNMVPKHAYTHILDWDEEKCKHLLNRTGHIPKLIPTPRPSWAWGPEELKNWRIKLDIVPHDQFFGCPELQEPRFKEPHWRQLLTARYPEDSTHPAVRDVVDRLLNWKDCSYEKRFATIACILKVLGVVDDDIQFGLHADHDFFMNHTSVAASIPCSFVQPQCYTIAAMDDIAFEDGLTDPYQLAQLERPIARLVAQAIAIGENNCTIGFCNEDLLTTRPEENINRVFPCILLTPFVPIFIRIPVPTELSNSVASGLEPTTDTHVSLCIPPIIEQAEEPMSSLINRDVVFRYYSTFTKFIPRRLHDIFIL
ncbi:hypothetical protein M422DRAFT_23917 [Sphaerobolus stellatus SS14]|nr:hypothetical protein M422DRAFT_23917 [Sphaerobolus stellatus SS14]